MTLEALLAWCHLAALLGWVVFTSSQAALARPEWLNAAVVERLVRVDRYAWICWAGLLASGLARSLWGMKGADWYWSQPLLHAKFTAVLLLALMAWPTTRRLRQWREDWRGQARLPAEAQVRALRRQVMLMTHAMLVVPALGVMLARGLLTR